ncbi:unnamed protein product [Penicillium salamii]|nr:unnamed protein product [Penicillium salamii]CAG8339679.1 unnamed protein product [Penicillium salamii]
MFFYFQCKCFHLLSIRQLRIPNTPASGPSAASFLFLQSLIIIIFTVHSLLLILLATLSLAQSSANITLPPFVPVPPKQPTNTSLPYGSVLNHCYIPGTVALTFDDGPYIYTSRVLDVLAHHGARATFFVNGRNRGHVDQFPELVKRAHEEGHQLGSHIWAHPSLPSLSKSQIRRQMTAFESAFIGILGFYPTYMRAPFLAHSDDVLDVMDELGYHVIGASVDTKDYVFDDPDTNWRGFERFIDGLDAGGTVVLAHDSHRNTVEILVEDMLEEIKSWGLSGKYLLILRVGYADDHVQLSRLVSVLATTGGTGLSRLFQGLFEFLRVLFEIIHEPCFCIYLSN